MCRIVLSDNTLDLYILPSALVCMILTLYDFRTCPAQENAGAIDMSMCVCICDLVTTDLLCMEMNWKPNM